MLIEIIIIENADSNSGLNFDENGERRPDEYAAYRAIHNYDKIQYIYHTRKLAAYREIPEDIKFLNKLKNMHKGNAETRFYHATSS